MNCYEYPEYTIPDFIVEMVHDDQSAWNRESLIASNVPLISRPYTIPDSIKNLVKRDIKELKPKILIVTHLWLLNHLLIKWNGDLDCDELKAKLSSIPGFGGIGVGVQSLHVMFNTEYAAKEAICKLNGISYKIKLF